MWFNQEITSNQLPLVIVSNEQVRCHAIDNAEIQRFSLCLPDNKTEGLPGYQPIVPNIPVLITHNIAIELHISNGSIGRLVKLIYENGEQSCDTAAIKSCVSIQHSLHTKTTVCTDIVTTMQISIHSDQSTANLHTHCARTENDNSGSYIMSVSCAKRIVTKQNKTTITITRCQLPIIPAYAMTTHK